MIMNVQLPRRCAWGQEVVTSVTIVHYMLGPGSAGYGCNQTLPRLDEWYLKRVYVGCGGNSLPVADLVLPLLPTASCCRQEEEELLTLSS